MIGARKLARIAIRIKSLAMSLTDSPPKRDFLEELRHEHRPVDWGRHIPGPQVALWSETLAQLRNDVTDEYFFEAKALIAKANRQPYEMFEALCGLAAISKARIAFVRSEIWSVFNKWDFVDWHSSPSEMPQILENMATQLTQLLSIYPKDRVLAFALSTVFRARFGPLKSLDYLEMLASQGVRVADLFLAELSKGLSKKADPEIIRRASKISDSIAERAGRAWYSFALHRSFIFAALYENGKIRRSLDEETRDCVLRYRNFEDVLAQTLLCMEKRKPLEVAKIFLTISKIRSFWRSPVNGSENSRIAVIDRVLERISSCDDPKERELLLRALFSMVPQTIRFWTNPVWRKEISIRIVRSCVGIAEPYFSLVRSRFLFSQEDYPAAKEAFANLAKCAPNKNGPATYVDPLSVADKIFCVPAAELGPANGRRVEILNDKPRAGEPVIIASANDKYLYRYGEAYVRRLSEKTRYGHVHLHLFADYDLVKNELYRLKDLIPDIRFSWSCEDVTINQPYYFATGRFLRLHEWLQLFDAPIIVTDIDSLWDPTLSRLPSDFIGVHLSDADVALNLRASVHLRGMTGFPVPGVYYPSADPWTAVLAGVMAFGATAGARKFSKILAKLASHELSIAAARSRGANWGIDQNILFAAYAYAFQNCPDIKFSDIWHSEMGIGQHWMAKRDGPKQA